MLASLERGSSDGFCFTSPIPEYATSKGWGKIILEPLNGDVPEAANVPYIIMATSPDVDQEQAAATGRHGALLGQGDGYRARQSARGERAGAALFPRHG